MADTWKLLFLGFGNVGRELARLLLAKEEWLEGQGLDVRVTGIVTRTRGLFADPTGLDLREILRVVESVPPATPALPAGFPDPAARNGPAPAPLDDTLTRTLDLIRSHPADVVVEMTPLRVDFKGEPAVTHVRTALAAGRHVVSANKGPVAWAYRDLDARARSAGRRFLFEATVMDGTPVFSLVRHTLAGCRVTGCRGVLNTTTNYVLERMAQGRTLEEAVREAQAGGFAEADPSLDLDGWDAAVKLACLANVVMGLDLSPEQVERTGIRGVTSHDLEREARRGRVVKLVAEAETGTGTGMKAPVARVRPQALPAGDLLALVTGTSSALTLRTDLMGPLTIFEHSPTLTQTAYGVFRDILEIAQYRTQRTR